MSKHLVSRLYLMTKISIANIPFLIFIYDRLNHLYNNHIKNTKMDKNHTYLVSKTHFTFNNYTKLGTYTTTTLTKETYFLTSIRTLHD